MNPRRRRPYLAIAALVLLVLAGAGVLAWPRIYDAARAARAAALLRAADASQRWKGAWILGPESPAAAFELLRDRLRTGQEPDDACREAYLYALGRLEQERDFELVTTLATGDPAGRARAAGRLAAVKISPQRFRAWAAAHPPGPQLWDRLGAAQAQLALDDFSAAAVLFEAAAAGDEALQLAASRGLQRAVRPLLEITGAWPADADPPDLAPWPAGLVARVQRCAARHDLQRIFERSRATAALAERTQRDLRRLTSARERLRRVLFWSGGDGG